MKINDHTMTLMARYLAGEMSMKEEIAFKDSLEHHPELQTELTQMEKSWKHIHDDPGQGSSDTRKAWVKLHNRLEADGLMVEPLNGQRNGSIRLVLKIAASVLLILAIGIPSLYIVLNRDQEGESTSQHYAEKGVTTVDLPDGSRVFLNEGAEITYPEEFVKERSVELTGEAFFEVMSDPVNPFTVRSGKVVVSVLGTSFNVKQAKKSDQVEVYVESGKVRVAMEKTGEFITLEPGEFAHAKGARISSSESMDPNYISWKTKDFKFVDEELGMVLRELEESYHVLIEAENVDLGDMRITTTYTEQSIDAILETISTAFGFTVSKKEEHYYLKQ